MAFGIDRKELKRWKDCVLKGELAFLTHYWYDARFPHLKTITKVGCADVIRLEKWGNQYGLKPEWMHRRDLFPHFDLLGERQVQILIKEGQWEQINKFHITPDPNRGPAQP